MVPVAGHKLHSVAPNIVVTAAQVIAAEADRQVVHVERCYSMPNQDFEIGKVAEMNEKEMGRVSSYIQDTTEAHMKNSL